MKYECCLMLISVLGMMLGCDMQILREKDIVSDIDINLPLEEEQIPQDNTHEEQILQNNTLAAVLDTPFQLKINQTASIASDNIEVLFLNITEDSRCPSTVLCVWEGQATALVKISIDDQSISDIILTSRAGHDDLAIKNFNTYSIRLVKVKPYPETFGAIPASEYEITMIISKIP